jgi:hypothetical protein
MKASVRRGSRHTTVAVVAVAVAAACGSEAAPGLLVRRATEPPGEHCALGGTAVLLGPDRDANGVLDDTEVERVEYECAAPTGVLVREDPLAPSLECPAGGVAVHTGIDDNGDGVLADAEIDQTAHVCASLDLWRGDVRAADWSDPVRVAALRGARVVTGSLELGAAPAELPLLARVGGDVTLGAPAAALELPALAEVGGTLAVETDVAPVALPALVRVGGDLDLRTGAGAISFGAMFGPGLTVHGELRVVGDSSRLEAPRLYSIDGALRIAAGAQGVLALPGLYTVGGDLELRGAPALHLDQLSSIGGGVLVDAPSQPLDLALRALRTLGGDLRAVQGALTSIELPQLQTLHGEIALDAQPLTRLALPQVTSIGGDVSVTGAPALASVDLGHLKTAGNIGISGAPALAELALPALTSAGRSGLPGQPAGIRLIGTGITAISWPVLRTVTGDVCLSSNAALGSVQLPQLVAAASLQVDGSPVLATVTAPALVGAAPPDIVIAGPVQMLDLRALVYAGTITLDGVAISDLSGLRALFYAQVLQVRGATRLRDLRGLAALGRLSSVELVLDGALTSLDGMEPVRRIPGALKVQHNPVLTSVAGLRHLVYVEGDVVLGDCPALAALAFPELVSIDGALDITGMSAVTSLSGLGALTAVGGAINIADNSSLPDSEVDAFLARLGH